MASSCEDTAGLPVWSSLHLLHLDNQLFSLLNNRFLIFDAPRIVNGWKNTANPPKLA